MEQPVFGERLRHLRTARGLSQRALAGELVTPSYISLVESGRRTPTLDVVVHLAQSLGVSLNELLGQELEFLAPSDQQPTAVLLTEILARELLDLADYTQAAEILGQALQTARSADDPARILDVGLRLQEVLAATNQHSGRVALLDELLELATIQDAIELQIVLRTDLAGALRDAGRCTEARDAALTALQQIETSSLHRTSHHVKLLGVMVSILVELDDSDRLEDFVSRLLVIANDTPSPALVGRAHWVANRAYAHMGDWGAAKKHLGLAQQNLTSPNMPLRDWMRFCRSSAAVLLGVGEDLEQARTWLQSAGTAARVLAAPGEQELVAALQARLELALGNPQRTLDIVAPLLAEQATFSGSDLEFCQLRLLQACATVQLGRLKEAEPLLRRLASDCERSGHYRLAVQAWRTIDELRHSGSTNGARA